MGPNLQLRVSIHSKWESVTAARAAVANALRAEAALGAQSEAAEQAVSMTVAELLENAVRHGGPDTEPIHLCVERAGPEIVVTVRNSVPVGSPSPSALVRRLEWLRGFADPLEAYQAALLEVYDRPVEDGGSGLGLVRIVCEGGCAVDCEVSDAGEITVRATYPGPARGAAP